MNLLQARLFRTCQLLLPLVFVGVCYSGAIAQSESPQPDDTPVQSAQKLMGQFDADRNQVLNLAEFQNAIKQIMARLDELENELAQLKSQRPKFKVESKLHTVRKPGVATPADGGVYAGKYYPPAQGTALPRPEDAGEK